MSFLREVAYTIPCHRKPERSLKWKGKPMPICSRCLAIYSSYITIPILFLFIEPTLLHTLIATIMFFPMPIDGYTQKWGWRISNNILRVVTGTMFGVSLSMFIVIIVKFVFQFI